MDTAAFVRRVADRVHRDESHTAAIIRLVFQEMRDSLTEPGASDLAAHLPPAVQPLWMETERFPCPTDEPYQLELLGTLMQWGALPDSAEAEHAIVAVFTALQDLLDRATDATRAVQEILGQLPQDLQVLWTAAQRDRTVSRAPSRADPLIATRPGRAARSSAA